MKAFVKRAKKAVVGAVGVAAQLVAAGVLDDQAEAVATAIIAAATVLGIYQARNTSGTDNITGGTDRV